MNILWVVTEQITLYRRVDRWIYNLRESCSLKCTQSKQNSGALWEIDPTAYRFQSNLEAMWRMAMWSNVDRSISHRMFCVSHVELRPHMSFMKMLYFHELRNLVQILLMATSIFTLSTVQKRWRFYNLQMMWCKLRCFKEFRVTQSLPGQIPTPFSLAVCLLKPRTAPQLRFPSEKKRLFGRILFDTHKVFYFKWNFSRPQMRGMTACWFWGNRVSARRTLTLNCVRPLWVTGGRMQFLKQRISLRT